MRILSFSFSVLVAITLQVFADETKAVGVTIPSSTSSTENTDFFSLDIKEIAAGLPFKSAIRLPSQIQIKQDDSSQDKYSFKTLSSSSEYGVSIQIFKFKPNSNCEQQKDSCLVGRISVTDKNNVDSVKEYSKYQDSAKNINLKNNLSGYLLNDKLQNDNTEFSQLVWQQDNQLYIVSLKPEYSENLVSIANSIIDAKPIQNQKLLASEIQEESRENTPIIPNRRPVLTTAEHLRKGEILTTIRTRRFLTPGDARSDGLTDQPTIGISWGVTDNLEITYDAQTVDNAGPGYQGEFKAQRINDVGRTNFFQERALQAKYRIWQNENATQAISGVVAMSSGTSSRPYNFVDKNGIRTEGFNRGASFSFELPYTITPNETWQFTLSPKVAFLPENNALYYSKLPISNSGSFGTSFGLASGISYRLNQRLILWGDAYLPFTGNNTINRDTGSPTRNIAYNAGLRYVVNPRLATELFVSNTLGNTGALSVITDREYTALGFGLNYLPGVTSANRRYAKHFGDTQPPVENAHAGFAALDGGTVPQNQLLLTLQGGGQGFLPSLRYGLLDDFEIGTFLESIPGTTDESQFGFSGKIRFLNQAAGDPFTLSLAGTLARGNNVLSNFANNDRNRFQKLGLKKGGFAFSNEKDAESEYFIISLSTPMHYKFDNGSAAWFTPTLGFVQRRGLEIGGFNIGGSIPLSQQLDAIAELGLNLAGKGNGFIGDQRESVIPWTLGLRWQPFGVGSSGLQLEAYISNRLGSSPYSSLRVKADNETTLGVGMVLPIQF